MEGGNDPFSGLLVHSLLGGKEESIEERVLKLRIGGRGIHMQR